MQLPGQEPELVACVRDNLDFHLAPDLGWSEGFEATMVGVGGGFADTTFSPFETLNPLSDFTIAKESPSLVECEIVDDSLTYQSTASLSSWSIPTGGLDFNYDFDSSSIPPTSS